MMLKSGIDNLWGRIAKHTFSNGVKECFIVFENKVERERIYYGDHTFSI